MKWMRWVFIDSPCGPLSIRRFFTRSAQQPEVIKSRIISIFSQTWCKLWFKIDTGGHYSREFLLLVLFEKPNPVLLLIICQKMRKRWQMIGLLSINHSVKTKDKKTPGRRGEWTESSGLFYGRFREFGFVVHGRFRGEWVKIDCYWVLYLWPIITSFLNSFANL